jgi:hypothetical protein
MIAFHDRYIATLPQSVSILAFSELAKDTLVTALVSHFLSTY